MADPLNLRELPAVHDVVEEVCRLVGQRYPRKLIVLQVRRSLDDLRADLRSGRANGAPIAQRVANALAALEQPSLRRVINATGVVLHTNLGRAPLGPVAVLPGYSNLEYDLAAGRRGRRDVHASALFERLLSVPGVVVNNNAAAIFLALHELAKDGEVVVSRGELVEIGDGFRIPEIMAQSGAILREVGATNRTRVDDYRAAINDRTRLLLRVHPSNFRITGFTERPRLGDLAALARERGIPLYEDLGSGCIADLRPFGVDEPLVAESIEAGADLVSFSGDKLLGGPQAGILAGRPDLLARIRRNPLFRALRIDKMTCQALEHTLRSILLERWQDIPALAMLRQSSDEIKSRAETVLSRIPGLRARIVPGNSVAGGGATPEQPLPTWVIAVDCASVVDAERALRQGDPAIVCRIEDEALVIDLRTVFREEEEELAAALRRLQEQGQALSW